MNYYFIHFVLGQRNGNSEGIVQLLIFIVFIVALVIKNLFIAKKQQNQKQKKPIPHSSVPRTSAGSEKARLQRERVEKFLEGILQPRRAPQQSPSRPVPPKPQAAGATPVPVKVPQITKVFTDQSTDTESYREMSAAVRQAESDTILDTNAIKIDNRLEEIPLLKEEHIQEDQRHLISHKKSVQTSGKKLSAYVPSFSDSDDLKKAILYAEILGKPISLRESEALFD